MKADSKSTTRILLADDEPRILEEYVHVLGSSSDCSSHQAELDDLEAELFGAATPVTADQSAYELCLCSQGGEAVEAVERAMQEGRPFAVAFLDIRMPPGADGVSAAERIRAIDPFINIVFVTGFSDIRPDDITRRVMPADKVLYCQKPLQSTELKQFARALSAKWAAERDLYAARARLHQLLTSTSAVVYSCACGGDYATTFISANIAAQFGYAPEQFLADPRFWIDRVHEDDRARVRRDLSMIHESGELVSEYRLRAASGAYRWVNDQVKLLRNSNGEAIELVGCMIDITDRWQAEERIRKLAYFDGLTGLPNRTLMKELLEKALANAARYQRSLAVLFLDIDHFKRINDTLGHDAGDTLLREVAKRLLGCVRSSDQVARQHDDLEDGNDPAVSRLGGDEFVVILTEVQSPEDATRAVKRIAKALAAPVKLAHDEVQVRTSIGISVYPDDGGDAETLLKHADAAMYQAKEEGRNLFRFFTRELNERAARRYALETKLRKAVEHGDFVLHYQPKIDIQRRAVVGMEALLRWHQPGEGLIPPGEFIPLAEENGLIVPIGDWVLQEACRQAAAWRAEGLPALAVSVNLSAVQFKQKRLVERIARLLSETGLDARLLELELTESVLIEDTEASAATLNSLKQLGLNVSIDDFGTGYSSLSYLKRFPLNALKVDRSFVRDITTDPNDAAIVSATIALAHNLRLRVVAEGVEQRVQVDILKSQGCDEAQGYLFSRPLPAAEFARWLITCDLSDHLGAASSPAAP